MEGIFRINKDGLLLSANNSLLSLLNITTSENNNINIRDILFGDDEYKKIIQLLESKGPIKEYIIQTTSNGKESILSMNLRPSSLNDSYYDGSILDVTEKEMAKNKQHEAFLKLQEAKFVLQEKSEELLDQSDKKIQFLAKINHDLKTPINSISLILDMITTDIIKDKAELKEYAAAAKISTDSILNTLDKYLDFTMIEAGKLQLEPELFTMQELLKECNYLLLPLAISRNLSLIFQTEENLPNIIEGDKVHFKQVIVNLVNNAIKFTLDGQVKIYMKMGKDLDENFEIVTEVSDTGIGIPEDKLDHLFIPYSQVDHKRDSMNGSGLGLIICKEFVNLLGGNIYLNSEFGKGSTFTFSAIFKKVTVTKKII